MSKTCKKCNTMYEIPEKGFHFRSANSDGLQTVCKKCNLSKKHRVVHINSEDKILCTKCFIYKEDDDFDIAKDNWFRRKKDRRCIECKKLQYLKRRVNGRGKRDVNRLLLERWHGIKERAAKKNYTVDFNWGFLKELWEKQKGLCAISKIEMTFEMNNGRIPTNVSVDKINSKDNYTKDNIQLVCMAVNQMKNDLTIEQLLYFCKEILKENESKN